MMDLDDIFRHRLLNLQKLLDYGFVRQGDLYVIEIPVMEDEFCIQVNVDPAGKVAYKVLDSAFGEEYLLAKVASVNGGFVGVVRDACEKILIDISERCFDLDLHKSDQSKRIKEVIIATYGIEPEYLWAQYPDYGVFKRKDNGKWFTILMTVNRKKIGMPGAGDIEIINMKAVPEKVNELLQEDNYYPAYHMNKKHWFTVPLDGSIEDDTLLQLLSDSYQCVAKR